jgi:hypothetical protein
VRINASAKAGRLQVQEVTLTTGRSRDLVQAKGMRDRQVAFRVWAASGCILSQLFSGDFHRLDARTGARKDLAWL